MNSKIIVQIYEIQEPREAEVVCNLGVDRLGSVLLSDERWKVPSIREAIAHEILCRAIDYYQPDLIHFCESLTENDGQVIDFSDLGILQEMIKERYPQVEIMRSVPVSMPESRLTMPTLEIAEYFEGSSDYFLTDTSITNQPVDGYIGITGEAGDWHITRELVQSSSIPVIAAGGLSPQNVYDAIMAVRPFGVDSCTRTNRVDRSGKKVRFTKDPDLVKAFVQEVRRAENDIADSTTSRHGRK
jgi:phosphoribosylanthranilate isomerase